MRLTASGFARPAQRFSDSVKNEMSMKRRFLVLLAGGGLFVFGWFVMPYLSLFSDPPIAKIYADPGGGAAPLATLFTNVSENIAGGELQSEWSIDGTVVATRNSFLHRFLASGTYTATLKVTDTRGKSSSTSVTIKVAPRLQWSMFGSLEGSAACVLVNEPADPDPWGDNYLCSTEDFGIAWSSAGPIAGRRCVQVTAPTEPAAHGWHDNYLCVPDSSPLELRWSAEGKIAKMICLQIKESADKDGWTSSYLCYTRNPGGVARTAAGGQPSR